MSRAHSHRCARCDRPFGCAGELIRNWDGFPDVICQLFHVNGDVYPQFRECPDCLMTTFCDDCGERPASTEHDGDRLCATCHAERVNA